MGLAETSPERQHTAPAGVSETSTFWPDANRVHFIRILCARQIGPRGDAQCGVGRRWMRRHKRLQQGLLQRTGGVEKYINCAQSCSTGYTNCPILCTY
jgi:hypothetical protein